jgi:hypothetical protein
MIKTGYFIFKCINSPSYLLRSVTWQVLAVPNVKGMVHKTCELL